MATVVFFTDGTKTKAICNPKDEYNPVAGFAIALAKKFVGNDTFNELIKEYALPEEERCAGEKNSENIEYTDLDYVDVPEPVAKPEKKVSLEKKTASKTSTAKKPAAKAKAAKLEIFIQSPMGGNITPEEIAAKLPKGAKSVFVRVDQNKLWWINGEETGSVDIW
jgi:hypothetical protein